jgi:valacyclovir hydrolase
LRREFVGGFRVIAVDLPGSGRSQPRHYASTNYLDDARILLGLLDELRLVVAHLVGFSDSGEEALTRRYRDSMLCTDHGSATTGR